MAEMRQRSSPYEQVQEDYEKDGSDTKGHPPPAKQVGVGMLIGMGLAAIMVLGFIYYIEEERWKPDWEMHAKVVAGHKRQKESHAHLNKILKDVQGKAERGELPHHEPTPEEIEAQRMHEMFEQMDHDEHFDHDDAPGMINALGEQMHDSKWDLQHRMQEFWDMDKNKDAFLSEDDFAHLVKRPVHLTPDAFAKLDTNKDGAVGIREFCAGFHDSVHMKEPWYHHKYGYVYGHEVPEHFSKARPGAVKKGTAEHDAMKSGVHPAQVEKKISDKKLDEEHKELNEKAHAQEEKEHELQEKDHAKHPEKYADHHD